MKTYEMPLTGVCARSVTFTLDEGVVRDVSFNGGCHGNTQAVAKLADGRTVDELVSILEGIDCRGRGTSCGDQFAKALLRALKEL